MATILTAKAPTEVVQRRWTVPVDADDGAESVSLTASGVTVASNSFEGDELVLNLSGGTGGTTAYIIATVTTKQGRTLVDTLYIPIILTGAVGVTVQEICNFALRKVEGLGEVASGDALNDALERLSDMLRLWRESGADIAAPDPLESGTTIYCPSSYIMAIKNNLILELADLYGVEVGGRVIQNARVGLAHIKQANLSPDRLKADYY